MEPVFPEVPCRSHSSFKKCSLKVKVKALRSLRNWGKMFTKNSQLFNKVNRVSVTFRRIWNSHSDLKEMRFARRREDELPAVEVVVQVQDGGEVPMDVSALRRVSVAGAVRAEDAVVGVDGVAHVGSLGRGVCGGERESDGWGMTEDDGGETTWEGSAADEMSVVQVKGFGEIVIALDKADDDVGGVEIFLEHLQSDLAFRLQLRIGEIV